VQLDPGPLRVRQQAGILGRVSVPFWRVLASLPNKDTTLRSARLGSHPRD